MDISHVEHSENSGQHVSQVENDNPTKIWTLVAHKYQLIVGSLPESK